MASTARTRWRERQWVALAEAIPITAVLLLTWLGSVAARAFEVPVGNGAIPGALIGFFVSRALLRVFQRHVGEVIGVRGMTLASTGRPR